MDIHLDTWTMQVKECQLTPSRQATEEPLQEVPRYRQDQGPQEEQELNVTRPRLSRRLDGDGDGRFAHSGYSNNSNGYKSSKWLWTCCSRTRMRTRRWGGTSSSFIVDNLENTQHYSYFNNFCCWMCYGFFFFFFSFLQKDIGFLCFMVFCLVLLPYGK